MKNCKGSSKIYTIKSQYTHHLSLLQMMSPPTPKRKKKVLGFGLWCVWNKLNTHTQYTHTSCGSGQNGLWYITLQSSSYLMILLAKWVYRLVYSNKECAFLLFLLLISCQVHPNGRLMFFGSFGSFGSFWPITTFWSNMPNFWKTRWWDPNNDNINTNILVIEK